MRVLFMGTSPFAVPSLRALVGAPEHEVLAVVTQPDRPHGRGGKLGTSPAKDAALALGLPLLQPEKVRAKEFAQAVREMAPEIIVVAAFGQIIPQRVLDIPPRGCVNVHGSLLPRWRGAAPMQYALMAGDAETGVTTMMMDAGLDTGDILLQAALPLDGVENLAALEAALAALGADLLLQTLAALARGDCPRTPQDPLRVTLSPSLPPDIGELDWERPASELYNLVRGVTPKPGAYALRLGRRLKVLRAEAQEESAAAPGVIENIGQGGITIGTTQGSLRLLEVQPESKGRMAADAWARGARLVPGQKLESEKVMAMPEERLERGIAYKIEGRYTDATAELRALLAEDDAHTEAHHQLGLVLGFIGEFDESLAELERAAALDGGSVLARNDLALTYTMLGMYEEAKAEFERVLEQDGGNDIARRNLTYLQ